MLKSHPETLMIVKHVCMLQYEFQNYAAKSSVLGPNISTSTQTQDVLDIMRIS